MWGGGGRQETRDGTGADLFGLQQRRKVACQGQGLLVSDVRGRCKYAVAMLPATVDL